MNEKAYLISTRKNEKLYSFLVNSVKLNAENILKIKLNIKYLSNNRLPNFNFLIFIFCTFVSGIIFSNKKFIRLKYKDYSIGRHILSHCMRQGSFYKSKIIFFFNKVKFLIIAGKIIHSFDQINNSVKAAYIDHGMYINGLYIQAAIKKKIIIYSNNFPKGIFCYDFRDAKKSNLSVQYEDLLRLEIQNISNKKILKTKKILKKICLESKLIHWLSGTKYISFKKKNFNFNKVTHIIYAHSFTETQYIFGFDEFLTYEDWLIFTIKKLSEDKNNFILVKAHPNFYTKDFSIVNYFSDMRYIDIRLFNEIKIKFKYLKNVLFLDYPVRNIELLNKVNKNTIIVSRTSTALIDGVYFGFKVICSGETFWDAKKLKIANHWFNSHEYENLLKKKWENLSYFPRINFYKLCYELYCNPINFFGKNFWALIIKKHFKIPDYDLEKAKESIFKNNKHLKTVCLKISKDSIAYRRI